MSYQRMGYSSYRAAVTAASSGRSSPRTVRTSYNDPSELGRSMGVEPSSQPAPASVPRKPRKGTTSE